MRNRSAGLQVMSAAQRGQIVQRVIVGGWTTAQAAAAFGVPAQLVEVWVADYRRHGMASLRHAPSRTLAAEILQLRLLLPARAGLRRFAYALRRIVRHDRPPAPAPLRRSGDDRRGGA